MLFADADGFWKAPNVFDVIGLVGLVIGFVSIWLAVRYAERDITKRIAEAEERASRAARDEVRRVAHAVLQTGIADAIRLLELTREACRGKRWLRASELCEVAGDQLARVLVQPAATGDTQAELQSVSVVLLDCLTRLRHQPKQGTGELPEEVLRGLDEAILSLHRVEGRMTGIRLEADRG